MAGNDLANDCVGSTAPCATISAAVAQSVSGDTIKVTGGAFYDFVDIEQSTTLVLSGGWASDFSARDASGDPTVVRPMQGTPLSRQLFIGSSASPGNHLIDVTVDGFRFERGADVQVMVWGRAGDAVSATLRDVVITKGRKQKTSSTNGAAMA